MTLPNEINKLQSEMSATVKAHWKAFLFEGILLAVLGLAAMVVPPLASLPVAIFLGLMFLISGHWRADRDVLGPQHARLLVVADFGSARRVRRHDPVGKAGAGRPHAHHRRR